MQEPDIVNTITKTYTENTIEHRASAEDSATALSDMQQQAANDLFDTLPTYNNTISSHYIKDTENNLENNLENNVLLFQINVNNNKFQAKYAMIEHQLQLNRLNEFKTIDDQDHELTKSLLKMFSTTIKQLTEQLTEQ